MNDPTRLLSGALAARADLFDPQHRAAIRLFAGFYEGAPDLVVDLYASTLVIHNYADPPERGEPLVQAAAAFYARELPWIDAVATKPRHARDPERRRGALLAGGPPAREVREDGVRYSVDILGARDAGFFLDTRAVRAWARANLAGKRVLNTFAYTGSLGVAAMAGGAAQVVHTDVSRDVLSVAKTSYTLNGLPIRKADFVTGDFWVVMGRMRRAGALFDCAIVDPPFFALSGTGTVDMQHQVDRLLNKVRPLVADGGYLIAINNALFLSGADYVDVLERTGDGGYLTLEALLPVPAEVTGYPTTVVTPPPVDPAPFDHATKIAVLRVNHRP